MESQRGVVMNRGAILARGRQVKITKKVLLINNYHYHFLIFFHKFRNTNRALYIFYKQSDQNPRRHTNFSGCGFERASFRRLQTKFVARPQAPATPTVLTS